MELQFLGATGTVTGSRYLVRSGGRQVLVDCGLFQGYKQLRLRNWAPLPFDPHRLDAVILTHAHIDHTGYLPLLARNGFKGRIWCTGATADLCRIMLPDSAHLQEEEAAYANRKGFSKHKPALPLYTLQDAQRCLKQFNAVGFRKPVDLGGGLTAQLLPAGHLLGAAMVSLQGAGGSILFSGDIGRPHDVLMKPPAPLERHDWLVLESTYGDRLHPPDDAPQKLAEVVTRTVGRGGVLLVPSFAVGRTQAVLYHLGKLRERGAIPEVPVFVNSPMATEATRVYMDHQHEHRLSRQECQALCASARFVQSIEESQSLNARQGPMIIIAGSGMATGGRIVHHLKAFAPDERSTILFTGYQTGGTRGAALVNGASSIKIHGQYVPVRAEVAMIDTLSGHADAAEILDWLKVCPHPPHTTWITHGEPAASDALRLRIEEQLGWRCEVPEYLQQVKL